MMKSKLGLAFLSLAVAYGPGCFAAFQAKSPAPEATTELLAQGEQIYIQRCSVCHGITGDGDGPAAKFMDPRPRDFRPGIFKFRSTRSGALPTDQDLFRTISRGLNGTAMQGFDDDLNSNGLSETERWAVIAHLKSFAARFNDPANNPMDTGQVIQLPDKQPEYNEAAINKGRSIFKRAKCQECHGKLGRGDGAKSADRKDDWGYPIRIRNLTHSWGIKAGSEVADIYMRFTSGISGTPMPAFENTLNEQDRWYLANYIKSLQLTRTDHQVLGAAYIEGEVPTSPEDERWQQAEAMDIRITGQVIAPPRWQNPAIDLVSISAIYNDTEIAFKMAWDDPFKDIRHDASKELDTSALPGRDSTESWIEANGTIPRQLKTFRDSLALQFPVGPVVGSKKPHFFRGAEASPVQLWVWRSDARRTGQSGFTQATARGWKKPLSIQEIEGQQLSGEANWEQGRWQLVMKRALNTNNNNSIQFPQQKFIPVAINVWDGSNGEHGLIMGISSWYYVTLQPNNTYLAYLKGLLGAIVAGLFMFYLQRKARSGSLP